MASKQNKWLWFIPLALGLGFALRLSFPSDIEYKYDEDLMFKMAQPSSEQWPALGMASGVELKNPGFSVWVFQALYRIASGVTGIFGGQVGPVELAQSVQLLNCAALILLLFFAVKWVRKEQRELWLWVVALACVNPISLIYDRKIWAQSVLPIFSTLFLMGWWRRDQWWGAFIWGLLGALMGQIHMSGFFFAGGFFLWTVFFGSKNAVVLKPHWVSWLGGSALGGLPLIPWINYFLNAPDGVGMHGRYWGRLFEPTVWWYFFGGPFGLEVSWSLGIQSFLVFLKSPWIGTLPTFWVGILVTICGVLGILVLGHFFYSLWQALRKGQKSIMPLFRGQSSPEALAQNSALLGMTFLLMLTLVPIHRHYLIVVFPLGFLWLVRVALPIRFKFISGSHILAVLWLCQLLTSAAFLGHIHVNGGAPQGDYGRSFSAQMGR